MRIGVGYYSMQSTPAQKESHAALYAEMLEQVVLAEALGFDSVWLTEHHLLEDGYCPSLLTTAAAIAARTNRIKIGTGVLLLPLHDPIRVAEDAAVVDNISGGRLILGIGVGYRPEEFDLFDRSLRERRGRMDEGIEVLRKAWGQQSFSFSGEYYNYEHVNVTPKPVQESIPLVVGAFVPAAIRRAARIGAPLYIPAIGSFDVVQNQFGIHADFLREFDRDPSEFDRPLVRDVCVHPKGKAVAWRLCRDSVIYSLQDYARWGSLVDLEGNPINDPDDPIIEEIAKRQTIYGSPEECRDEILEYRDTIGIDPLICRFSTPGNSHDAAIRSMKLFADEVMPGVC